MSKEIVVNVCMGTGGIAAGGKEVLAAFVSALDAVGVNGQVEKHCAVHKVGCGGFCARDVLVDLTIDGKRTTYQYIKPDMVNKIVEEHIGKGKPIAKWLVADDYHDYHKYQTKVLLADTDKIDPEDIATFEAISGYQAARKAVCEMTPVEVVREVKESGLRGRGGAGFPTGKKWEKCAQTDADQRYIICNADEGDPGSFMDRTLIEGNPHAIIEGMIIGAQGIGASQGIIFIRAEYQLAVERLKVALDASREKGFLGKGIFGSSFDFDIKIFLGPGAFVCGEETAMIASIEGKRGMPQAKPQYLPAVNGLWGKPTLINNVETLANLRHIINRGAQWFSSIGTETSKGTKLIVLTGKVKNGGLIEVPMGMSIKDIVFKIGGGLEGGKFLKAVYSGGPTGGVIPLEHIDLKLDYENLSALGSMLGSGILSVMDENDCMVNLAKIFFEFTQEESCGKCTPCRVGSKRVLELLVKLTEGEAKKKDLALLKELSEYMKASSLCGLGTMAPNPLLSTMHFFMDEYEAHLKKTCPGKTCKELLIYLIREDVCKGCGMCKKVCPAEAISGEKKETHSIDPSVCARCGACYEKCKFSAIIKE